MTDSTSSQDRLVCKPTKWFLWRALAMLVMFGVFAVLFLKDGMWGYRDKNLHYYMHATFSAAGEQFQDMYNAGGLTEAVWKEHASGQKCKFPENVDEVMPEGTDSEEVWPAELVNGFAVMEKEGGQNGAISIWKQYSSARKWSEEPAEHAMDAGEIRDQFVAAIVAAVLMLVTLFFLIRTQCRSIEADDKALYTQDGRTVRYADMVRIDKRKWDTKGLALVYYKDGGEEKRAKIDGMVYGQFKEEDGAPAEKLFSHVMSNFKGEVLEYVAVDGEEEMSNSGETADS